MNNKKSNRKLLISGVAVILLITLFSQAAGILTTVLAKSTNEALRSLADVSSVLRIVLDVVIFSAGAALILAFVRRSDRLGTVYACLASLTVLALDYGVSYIIDLSYSLITGSPMLSLINFIANYLFRIIVYVILIRIAVGIRKKRGAGEEPIPFIEAGHPVSRMLFAAFILRIAPFVVFELYSNVTGIITYGFDMTLADVLSIISAYVEILIDGAIAYCAAYLLLVAFSKQKKAKDAPEAE